METSIFPCWAAVNQMGHKTHYGWASISTELGAPMIIVECPAAEGDDNHDPLPASRELVAPASLYGVSPMDEATVMERRASGRQYHYRTPLLTERVDEAVIVSDVSGNDGGELCAYDLPETEQDIPDEAPGWGSRPDDDDIDPRKCNRAGPECRNCGRSCGHDMPCPEPLEFVPHPADCECTTCNPPF